ncbi:unnamed protein product [Clavelina lepadiformis]|uniref:Uncharacterized protein n=1 Tax=Clavelina lepadiformis TaxID=159417 RepID=A0ABP0GGU3_CLALP
MFSRFAQWFTTFWAPTLFLNHRKCCNATKITFITIITENWVVVPRLVAFASSPRASLVTDKYSDRLANYPDLMRSLNVCKETPFKEEFRIKVTGGPIRVKPRPIAADKMK